MRRAKHWTIMTLVLAVSFGMFGNTAWGASTRYAVITDVTGTVMATKSGGSKAFRVFKGMGLNEGDSIKVEKGSSVTLQVADHQDEMVLGENWNGVISKLRQNSAGGNDTSVKSWSGSMFSKVKKLTGSNDTYKVETPTAVMGVRGTHYSIVVDPVTGVVTMVVHSGQIAVGQSSEESDSPNASIVLPAQQLEAYSRAVSDDISIGMSYADLDRLIQFADDEVIEKILMNKPDIDTENNEQMETLRSINNSSLNLTSPEALQRYRTNVENILFQLLDGAISSNKLADEQVRDIINQANQQITDTNRKFDLAREVPSLDRTAGVDPEREQLRQRQKQAQQQREQQRQQFREQFLNQNQTLLDQIQQRREQQQQANQQARQSNQDQAQQQFLNSLNAQQRQQFQQHQQQIQQEQQSQDQRRDAMTPPATPPATGGITGGGGGISAPAPSLSLEYSSARSATAGFDIAVKLHNFTGDKAVYGVQLHFIHQNGLNPEIEGEERFYSSKFHPETTADNLKYEAGMFDGSQVKETIYALTVFGAGTSVPFNSAGEVLATIPFKGTGAGSVRLAYVQIVDSNGDSIATWSSPSNQLPGAVTYSN